MSITQTSPMGHNNPPAGAEIETINGRLADQHNDLLARYAELMEAVGRVPEKCDDDDTAGKISDMIKLLTSSVKALDSARVQEKEPYLTSGRAVDNFFGRYIDELDKAKKIIRRPLDAYLQYKAEEERRRRAEEAERLRKQAQEAAALAEQQRRESEARAAQAAAEEAARLNTQANATMQQALDSEKAADKTDKQAEQLQKQADREQKAAEAKPADLAKARGRVGSTASLRTFWVGEINDFDTLDLNTIRAYIPRDALQQAVTGYIKAGGRNLRGASIYEKSEAVVR